MLTAFLLGLTGSFGHCVGMCSGVSLLLSRKANATGWWLLLLHVGRLTTYGLLGALAGGIGLAINAAGGYAGHAHAAPAATGWPALTAIQGVLALLTAIVAVYMAVALVGHAPSPEIYLRRLTQGWGRLMRQVPGPVTEDARNPVSQLFTIYGLGLLWGLLPCGLVWAALLTAAVAASPVAGALTMVAFGLGTWPVGLSVSLAAHWPGWALRPSSHLRSLAAVVILVFGLQMALRGLAAWGMVEHLYLGGVMVW